MTPFTSLIIFGFLAAASLIVVSLTNEREKRRQRQQQQLRQMRNRVHELEEIVLEVEQLTENRNIARLINTEILDLILSLRNTHPQASALEASYQAAIARADTLAAMNPDSSLDRLQESDAQIARAQKILQQAGSRIRKLQEKNKISLEEMNEFVSELNWSHLMVSVISHIGQGHKALRRGDILSAHAFYKKAQQLLIQSNHPDERRRRFIKEVSEMLQRQRSAISVDLMPERHLNPEDSGPAPQSDRPDLAADEDLSSFATDL